VFSYSPEFGTWDFECGSATPNGEIALVFDWAEESDSADTGGTQGFAEAAADALYAALRDPWLTGNFEIVDDAPDLGIGYAGWRFHGGDKPGIATPWSSLDPPAGSTYYLSLFAGANNKSLTHNRLYVDESVGAIELTRRIAFSSANDRLQVLLTDGIVEETLADIDLSAATAWEIVSFEIPAQSVGLTQTLRFAIDGGGDGVEAVVDLDDVHFVPEPHGALLLAAGGAGLLVLARRREVRRGRDR
jgi:hypothetical protein